MADIADIGFRADTSALVDAKKKLEDISPAAAKAENSSAKLSSTLDKVGKSSDKVKAAIGGQVTANEKLAASFGLTNAAVETNAVANDAAAASAKVNSVASGELAAMTLRLTTVQNELAFAQKVIQAGNVQSAASAQVLAGVQTELAAATGRLAVADQALVAAQAEALATGEALAAVQAELAVANAAVGASAGGAAAGVETLAAGEAAAGVAGAGMSAGAIAGLAVLGIALLAIVAVVAVLAAAFGAGFVLIGKSVGDLTTGMGLTSKELDKLKEKGISTTVTMGDVFSGLKTTIYDAFKPQIDATIKVVWDFVVTASKAILWFAKGMISTFVGAFDAVKATWGLLPAALGDIVNTTANNVISGIESMINRVIHGINILTTAANVALIATGHDAVFGKIADASLDRVANKYAGAAAKARDTAIGAFKSGYDQAGKFMDKFGNDLVANTKKAGQKRIRDALGDGGNKKKTGGGSPSTALDGFDAIVNGAENDILAQKARAEATTLSAEAAAALTEKQKLLNEVSSKGLTLTDAMSKKIDELSAAYGKAKVAADNAVGLRDVLKVAAGDLAALQQQAELIGLVGRQLAYQTEMQKLLNDAKAKGMTADAIAAAKPQMEAAAGKVADQSQQNNHDVFMDGVTKGAQERMTVLKQEQAQIGLSADQVTRLRIENELLAQARQKNIDLTPADIAAIAPIAKEQADVENQLRKTREALDFAKDVAKGFFNDIRSGLSQGKSLWESFGQAAINALNKIVDKLLDKAIDAAINALFKIIGGFSDGGVFGGGGVEKYANGGTFTNSVVDRPTMFASGGALGVMGEAGPEAIMPLKRGNDGALGVQMHGGDNGGTMINAPITIQNDNRVTGAVSSADIVALQRSSAEQTKAQIARDIPNIIKQYQRDGAVV